MAVFGRVPHLRKPRGRRHSLAVMLTLATCALLAGARSFTAIGAWATNAGLAVAYLLGIARVPDESTVPPSVRSPGRRRAGRGAGNLGGCGDQPGHGDTAAGRRGWQGPTLGAHDLAVREALALFDRAEARDFTDVHDLAKVLAREELVGLARTQDDGFDPQVFVDMIGTIGRFIDDDLGLRGPAADRLRQFFSACRQEITGG
ncbi:transposase family protein [Frankia sp. Mgl5]|nr:transposase family protein [Frankia sp. Mgl5]